MNATACNPLYIVPHREYLSAQSAVTVLRTLRASYPSIRFGMLYSGRDTAWLVFRVHEQHQQGYALAAPDNGANTLFSDGLLSDGEAA